MERKQKLKLNKPKIINKDPQPSPQNQKKQIYTHIPKKVEDRYVFAPSIKYQHIINSSLFKGKYQQRNTTFYQTDFRALNGDKPPLIPLRVKDCNKLACIFDDKPQTKVFKCCSKKQYNNQQLVLDWRLAAVMKNVEKELSVPNQQWSIILLNNKVILRNETNKFEYHENIWVEGFGEEQLSDSRNLIKNQIKFHCQQKLCKNIKLNQQFAEAEQLYQKLINSNEYKVLKKNISDPNNNIQFKSSFLDEYKLGRFYVQTNKNITYIYLANKNSKINAYPVYGNNNIKQYYFKNDQNQIFSLSQNKLYKYTLTNKNQQKQDRMLLQQQYATLPKSVKLGKGASIVYIKNTLYVIGGEGLPKRFQSLQIGKHGQIKVRDIQNLQNCQKCKATIGGDGKIYIFPQGRHLSEIYTDKIYIFQLTPNQNNQEAKLFQIPSTFKTNKYLFDDDLIFSTIFIDGQPYIYLSSYDQQTQKCVAATIIIKDLQKKSQFKIQQIQNCPKFSKNIWITDTIGSVLPNSTRYLAKIQNIQNVDEVKEVWINGQGGILTWKVISY